MMQFYSTRERDYQTHLGLRKEYYGDDAFTGYPSGEGLGGGIRDRVAFY